MPSIKCKDHLGKEHESVEIMCKSWDVKLSTYYNRLNTGYTLEEALTGVKKRIQDHLGNSFENVQKMCDYWQISKKAYSRKRERGYTLEQALTNHMEYRCVDLFGIKHKTTIDMCKYWNVGISYYYKVFKKTNKISVALNIVPSIHTKGRPHKCFFFRDNFFS